MAATIARPRLEERARGALERGSLVVTAGAGYGKTTLIAQALDGGSTPARTWARLTGAERSEGRLVSRLASSLGAAVPGVAARVADRLEAAVEAVDASAALAELMDELERLLVDPVVLVLDDAEALLRAGPALGLLGELLRSPPAALRLAVASRVPLELPLARARAAGRLDEIGVAELSFDAGECARALAAASGAEPDEATVDAVMGRTEGWPLGVAAIARRGAGVLLDGPDARAARPRGPGRSVRVASRRPRVSWSRRSSTRSSPSSESRFLWPACRAS